MRKLLPLVLAIVGLLAGGGSGYLLRPPPDEAVTIDPCGEPAVDGHVAEAHASDPDATDQAAMEYVKLNNQFVVPVVANGEVAALVILSIGLEVAAGTTEEVYAREPKLRDGFLQVLFDHANAGGFDGAFTQSSAMEVLRNALVEIARKLLGSSVSDVLIVDIVRQAA